MQTVRKITSAVALALACSTAVLAESVWLDHSTVTYKTYDGVTDDLLSAGLNQAGLIGAAPPLSAEPTEAELRRRAIYNNYRAIVDWVPGGGMGVFWGPQSPAAPDIPGAIPGLIPGWEYKGYLRITYDADHMNNVPAAVQIPRHFNPKKPCIVAAMPSGSRSLYGAISLAEWGLFRGCAVALPGKGTDTGFHLLGKESREYAVTDLDGRARSFDEVGENAQFALRSSDSLGNYLRDNPYRVATKHAHSQINPERLWGRFGLAGIEFAFHALNDYAERNRLQERFDKQNTIVIAAGASNGGGMALRALEADEDGLIDGLVVTEPMIQPQDGRFVIKFGEDKRFDPKGRTLYDSITLMSVFAPCAALSPNLVGPTLLNLNPIGAPEGARENRCASLKKKGLVSGDTLNEQADSALARLHAHGYTEAQEWGIPSHEWLNLWRALQATYANAYGRFAIQDNVCGVSFAATVDNKPALMTSDAAKRIFAESSGVPATAGLNLIADLAVGGPIAENQAISQSTNRQDLNLDSALCFRSLETGDGLKGAKDWVRFARVQFGTREVQTSGDLRGKPAIVIHGRRDALVFPNLHSRAYYGLNQEQEGSRSQLRYIEVTSGQHFDAFISALFGGQFAPLHHYFVLAMDDMYDHLTKGTGLPPSQVVRPAGWSGVPYVAGDARLPAPSSTPAVGDRIVYERGVVKIPE